MSSTAILAPFVGLPVYEVTSVEVSLEKVEGWWQAKGIRSVKTLKGV